MLQTFLFALLLCCSAVQAIPPAPMPMMGGGEVPNRIKAGNQYYDMSVSGLGSYMDELKKTDPKAHAALLPELESLQTRKALATWIPAATIGAGVVLTAIEIKNASYAFLGIGTGLMVTGAFLTYILSNSRSNFMDFVNKHNRLRPKDPLDIQMGLLPTPSGVSGVLVVNF